MKRLRQLSDNELLQKYRDGLTEALAELIRRYQDQLYTAIFLLAKDKELAEDIFQETFIRVINTLNKDGYRDKGMFLAWVVRIAHNLFLDHVRKQGRSALVKCPTFDTWHPADAVVVSDHVFSEQQLKKIETVLLLLPPEQQEIIILRHYAGLGFRQIAGMLHISINTALGRMRYALRNCRNILGKSQFQD